MRLPVQRSSTCKGMLLEVNLEEETITLIGADGQTLGSATWQHVIEHILSTTRPLAPVPVRRHRRIPAVVAVRYRSADGSMTESRTSGIGGGGLFIESVEPLSPGSLLMVEFALPDQPAEWLQALCRVAWVCDRPDQYHFHPGMGVKFEEIPEAARERIIAFVNQHIRDEEA